MLRLKTLGFTNTSFGYLRLGLSVETAFSVCLFNARQRRYSGPDPPKTLGLLLLTNSYLQLRHLRIDTETHPRYHQSERDKRDKRRKITAELANSIRIPKIRNVRMEINLINQNQRAVHCSNLHLF